MDPWPSERVAHGGLFHLPKVTYSKETHALLKLLMDEQKMSILQRSRIENYLKNGAPLPKPTPLRMNTTKCRPNVDFLRARTAKRRTLAAIKASGALEYDKYRPKPATREPCEQQKIQLQAKMSGIKDIDETHCDSELFKKANETNEMDEIDPIDELLREISERTEWLNEMMALGEGEKHKIIMMNQIAEKMRLIKKIENERATKKVASDVK